MKINWGTGIVIAIALFMSFIIFMVVKMSTNNKYSHDLVVEDYYKQELLFQQEIDKTNNLKQLKGTIEITTLGENIIVTFPEELHIQDIEGKVIFYRPSNNNLDFEMPLSLLSHQWVFPKKNIINGRWDISVDFTHHNTAYLFKEEITL